jgi:hypothetical protein
MMPLPADLGESAEADAFNLLLYPRVRRVVTVRGFMKKNEARDTLNIALNWLLAVLGDMPAMEALAYMKSFEQVAADSIGYDLDEEA